MHVASHFRREMQVVRSITRESGLNPDSNARHPMKNGVCPHPARRTTRRGTRGEAWWGQIPSAQDLKQLAEHRQRKAPYPPTGRFKLHRPCSPCCSFFGRCMRSSVFRHAISSVDRRDSGCVASRAAKAMLEFGRSELRGMFFESEVEDLCALYTVLYQLSFPELMIILVHFYHG